MDPRSKACHHELEPCHDERADGGSRFTTVCSNLATVSPTDVQTTGADDAVSGTRRPLVVVGLVVALVFLVGYFALGMPGMDHGGAGMDAMGASDMAVGVDDFARRMAESDAFVVNVHVPDEGGIAGTDAAIPYDRVAGDARLPDDTATPIVLYCQTGRMSGEAATALMDAGYADVVHLDGGMDAWVAAGRSIG